MSDAVATCPECDSADLNERTSPDLDRWLCRDCRATFDEADARPARVSGPRSNLCNQLTQLSPDDLVTDGGRDVQDRITIRAPPALIEGFEALVEGGHYQSRAPAYRDALRRFLEAHPGADVEGVDLTMEGGGGRGNTAVPDGTPAAALDDANPDVLPDGGVPLAGQERCECGRLVVPEWDYCPACGVSLDGGSR